MNDELIENGQEPFVKDFSLVSVHIVVMANDTIELTINTKPANIPSNIEQELPIDDIEEMLENGDDLPPMPKFLENLIKSTLGLPVDWEDYDKNHSLQQSKPNVNHIQEQQKVTPIKEINTRKTQNNSSLDKNDMVFVFDNLNEIITFIQVLPNIKTSILLKYKDEYYLCLNNLLEKDKKAINYAECEFYIKKNNAKIPTMTFLNEHATIIIKENVIEKLKQI